MSDKKFDLKKLLKDMEVPEPVNKDKKRVVVTYAYEMKGFPFPRFANYLEEVRWQKLPSMYDIAHLEERCRESVIKKEGIVPSNLLILGLIYVE